MNPQEEQIEISKRLQVLWLKHMEKLLDSGEVTSTDLATLARFLLHNGWTLDPKQLPKSIKDLLKPGPLKLVSFDDDDENDPLLKGRELPPPIGFNPDAPESL